MGLEWLQRFYVFDVIERMLSTFRALNRKFSGDVGCRINRDKLRALNAHDAD